MVMRFKKGQQIVCVAKRGWEYEMPIVKKYFFGLFTKTINRAYGPEFNEVVTCNGYSNNKYIYLKEYSSDPISKLIPTYHEISFEPLISDEELAEELSTIHTIA
jgi:hypothetical protein